MRAAVIEESGGPEALKLQERPIPKPEPGWVLIRVKAFGINRSELFTRQGHSPGPRYAFPASWASKQSGRLPRRRVANSPRAKP